MDQRFQPEVFAGAFAMQNPGSAFFPEHVHDIRPAKLCYDWAEPAPDQCDADDAGQQVMPVEQPPELPMPGQHGNGHGIEEEKACPLSKDAAGHAAEGSEPPEES